MNRRDAITFSILGIAMLAGCRNGPEKTCPPDEQTCDHLWTQIKGYAYLGCEALLNVVKILADGGVVTTKDGNAIALVLEKSKRSFDHVAAAVDEYRNAPQDQKGTAAGKIITALEAVANHIEALWTDLSIPDQNVATTIHILITVIVSTARGFTLSAAHATNQPLSLRVAPPDIPAQQRSLENFKTDFNEEISKRGNQQYLLK